VHDKLVKYGEEEKKTGSTLITIQSTAGQSSLLSADLDC